MRISYSAFDTFNRCPLKYKFSYIEKVKVPKKSELYFGGLVHAVVQEGLRKDPIIPSLEELIKYLEDNWSDEAFTSKQEAEQYLDFGKNMIRNFHLSLKPGLRNIVATEKRFQIPLNDKHNLSGMIDRIDRLPYGAFEVIDYKTSKKPATQAEVDNDKQLGIYKLAVNHMWPEAKDVRLTLYFLKHPMQLSTTRQDSELETLKEEIILTAEKIEKATQRMASLGLETEFAPKTNSFCDWCEYGHLCPLQKHKINKSQISNLKSQNEKDIDKTIEEYISAHQKIADLEPEIHKHFDAEKIERFFHKEGTVTRGKNKKLTIKKS